MSKLLLLLSVFVIICQTVYTKPNGFAQLFGSTRETDCPAKIRDDVAPCVLQKSGLPLDWKPEKVIYKEVCCQAWVVIDCATEKAKGVCSDEEWAEMKKNMDELIANSDKGVCSEFQYKPNTWSNCKADE